MECNNKHNYSKIDISGSGDYNDINVNNLKKSGNKSISGLLNKCVAVKRKGCKK